MRKRVIYIAIVISAIIVCLSITIICTLPVRRLPKSDNIRPADEIITKYYSDEDIVHLFHEENDFICRYDTVRDLMKKYKIECVRKPALENSCEYSSAYIILASESGKRAFLFLDGPYANSNSEIYSMIVTEDFLSQDEFKAQLDNLKASKSSRAEWFDELASYGTGVFWGTVCVDCAYSVKEGAIVFQIWEADREHHTGQPGEPMFYSDEFLFSGTDEAEAIIRDWGIFPVLPIDKNSVD